MIVTRAVYKTKNNYAPNWVLRKISIAHNGSCVHNWDMGKKTKAAGKVGRPRTVPHVEELGASCPCIDCRRKRGSAPPKVGGEAEAGVKTVEGGSGVVGPEKKSCVGVPAEDELEWVTEEPRIVADPEFDQRVVRGRRS